MKTKIRKRKCKNTGCDNMFTPKYSTIEPTCSIKCLIEYNREKKAKNKSELNKMRNEKSDKDSLSTLIKQTQILVNKYIRLRDKGKPCISCNKKWNNRHQAGHRFDVKQHNGIRFDLFNINNQCEGCNIFKSGNYQEYDLRLSNRIGDEEYQKLHKRAKIALRVPYTWTKTELRTIQKEVKTLIKELD